MSGCVGGGGCVSGWVGGDAWGLALKTFCILWPCRGPLSQTSVGRGGVCVYITLAQVGADRYTFACTQTHICAHVHTYAHAHRHDHKCTQGHRHIDIGTHRHTHTHTNALSHRQTYTYTYTCKLIRTHTHTCTHAHIHTHL